MLDKDAAKEVVVAGSQSLTFISQIISAIAWPATILICVLAVRKHVSTILPFIRTLKYSDVEIQFGKEIAELAKVTEKTSLPSESPKGTGKDWEDLIVLSDVRPRSAIRSAWRRVVDISLAAAKENRVEISDSVQSMPMVVGSLLLNKGIITFAQYDLLSRLRRLRNDAEHLPPDAISSESAVEFVSLALRLAASIAPKPSN